LAAYERWQNLTTLPAKLSPQYLAWRCNKRRAGSLDIRKLRLPFKIIAAEGCALAADWEYELHSNAGTPPPGLVLHKLGQPKIKSIRTRTDDTVYEMREKIADRRYICVELTIYESWKIARGGDGIVSLPGEDEEPIGSHAVCLVGYMNSATDEGGGHFVFRNSQNNFAPHAKIPGYGTLPYAYFEDNDCRQALYFSG
jgi:hypothetical protein